MKTLSLSIRTPGAMGRRLRLPWRLLDTKVTLRTSELVVVAGGPAGGKSTVSANLAILSDFPILYVAQDSPASILARMSALTLQQNTGEVAMALNDERDRDRLAAEVKKRERETLVVHAGAITTEQLEHQIMALTEWLGEAPPLIIIDNLIDMIVPGHTFHETQFFSTVLPELKRIALKYDVCVMVLHHVVRTNGSGQDPIKLTDLLYAGERQARHVWGIYNDGGGHIYIQILKQQDGEADPGGSIQVPLAWYPTLTRLTSREDG